MAEMLGRGGHMAPEAVNCAAPDTGNMGVWSSYCPRVYELMLSQRFWRDMARPNSRRSGLFLC